MLILKPLGRGNWQKTYLTIERSKHSPLPLEFFAGQRMELAGRWFRICRVLT